MVYFSLDQEDVRLSSGVVLLQTSKMTRWIMTLTTKPDNLHLTPRTHVVEEKNKLLQVVLHMHIGYAYTYRHTYTQRETETQTQRDTHTERNTHLKMLKKQFYYRNMNIMFRRKKMKREMV